MPWIFWIFASWSHISIKRQIVLYIDMILPIVKLKCFLIQLPLHLSSCVSFTFKLVWIEIGVHEKEVYNDYQ